MSSRVEILAAIDTKVHLRLGGENVSIVSLKPLAHCVLHQSYH